MDMSNHPLLATSNDPPPFPPIYPQLSRIDKSLICQICKEPFSGPVTVACGHSFCSQCIRGSLDVMKDKKCPACDAAITEGSIRRNRILEEIADAWEDARPSLITLTLPQPAHAGPSRRRHPPEHHTRATNPKRARAISGSRSTSPSKSRKVSEERIEILDSDDVHDDERVVEEEVEEAELNENDEGECPLCQASMAISSIPMHIERGCPPPKAKMKGMNGGGAGNQGASWKKVFAGVGAGHGKEKSGKEKPVVELNSIKKPNYAIASPADLRSMLTDYDLPTTGDKPTLQNRLQQWIILYNSNLDTSHPKSLSALRARLNEIESAKKRDRDKGKDEAVQELGTAVGMARYVKEKGGEFERLRKDIVERDRIRSKNGSGGSGKARDTAIEVD